LYTRNRQTPLLEAALDHHGRLWTVFALINKAPAMPAAPQAPTIPHAKDCHR
jgi:hypothetical protein